MSATATPPRRGLGRPALPKQRPARTRREPIGLRPVVSAGVRTAWVLLRLVVVLACLAVIIAWRGFDVTPISIISGSMEPTIPTNSLIFVEEVAPGKIREGDVITFDPPGPNPRVTHRVVERERVAGEWYFITKGDANDVRDDWRTPEAIEAGTVSQGVTYGGNDALRHVWGVPYAGHILKLTEQTRLRMVLVFGSLAAILVLLLVAIWRDDDEDEAVQETETTRQEAAR